ncbi:hypothetical protein GSI_04443 [Ganoderma sinense ZZ0214-1]|uniref:F-box domain-containing protein n=1 Tax=Ganoderma sinense ZZ0214-1 TaxID=1077348 RepID=A0A2G8SJU4_9APHY|nr:hypothetical protein GSI_04443 [Ganoderma sinense ZZ0214-1]
MPPIFKLSRDPLAMICDYLLPAEVLSLYRSCKTIHGFLQLTSSKGIWKSARANVAGLPECPEWLTEPQYAALCFDDFCCQCLAVDKYSVSPIWPLYVRYCWHCRVAKFTTTPLRGFPVRDALGGFRSRPADLFPSVLAYVDEARQRTAVCYHVLDVEKFRTEVAALVQSNNDATVLAVTTAPVLAALEEKAANTAARLEFSRKCKTWKAQWIAQLKAAAKAVKLQRLQDILRKLEEQGYSAEVLELGPRHQGLSGDVLALVDQARPLTDRDWTAIRPMFTAFMEVRRDLGARVSFVRCLRSRLRLLRSTLFTYLHEDSRKAKRIDGARVFPTVLDLLDVRDAAYLVSLPDGAVLLPHLWVAQLPSFIEAWELGRTRILLSLLHGIEGGSPATGVTPYVSSAGDTTSSVTTRSTVPASSPLSHPAALFWCDGCMNLILGISAISHACCYGRAGPDAEEILSYLNPALNGRFSQALISSNTKDLLYSRTLIAFSEGVLPWSQEHLRGCVPIVRSVLEACGVNPHNLPKEMRKLSGCRVACRICCQVDKCVLAMGWLRAISHAFEVHGGQEGSWVRLCPKLEEKVKRIEYTSRDLFTADMETRTRWECSRCAWDRPHAGLSYTWPQLVDHFAVCHPMNHLSPIWYSPSNDTPPFMYPAVLLVERGMEGHFDEDLYDAFPRKHLVTPMRLSADTWAQL